MELALSMAAREADGELEEENVSCTFARGALQHFGKKGWEAEGKSATCTGSEMD